MPSATTPSASSSCAPSINSQYRVRNISYGKLTSHRVLREQLRTLLEEPSSMQCPISRALFVDPIIISTGHTYERDCISKWLQQSTLCPVSGVSCSKSIMIPNMTLKSHILQHVEEKVKKVRSVFSENIVVSKGFLTDHEDLVLQALQLWIGYEERLDTMSRHRRDIIRALTLLDANSLHCSPQRMLQISRLLVQEGSHFTAVSLLRRIDSLDLEDDEKIVWELPSECHVPTKQLDAATRGEMIFEVRKDMLHLMLQIYRDQQLQRHVYTVALRLASLLSENLIRITSADYEPLETLGLCCSWYEYAEFLERCLPIHRYFYGCEVDIFQFFNRMAQTYSEAMLYHKQLQIVEEMIRCRQRVLERSASYRIYMSMAHASRAILLLRFNAKKEGENSSTHHQIRNDLQEALEYHSENRVAARLLSSYTEGEDSADEYLSVSTHSTGSSSHSLRLYLVLDSDGRSPGVTSHSSLRTPTPSPVTPQTRESSRLGRTVFDVSLSQQQREAESVNPVND